MKVSIRQDKLIFRIIFGVVIVIGAALWWTYGFEDGFLNTSNVPAENTTAAPAGRGYDIGETAQGETVFTSYDDGYSLTLPEGWAIDGPDEFGYVSFIDAVALRQPDADPIQGMKVEVYAYEAEYGLLGEWVAEETDWYGADELLEQREVVVGSEPAVQVTANSLGYTITAYVRHNDFEYTISASVGELDDKEKYSAEFSKILDGFGFVE
ncbi:MAG: hypothetical protein WC505_06550 [Patescibacteria group bacterium]